MLLRDLRIQLKKIIDLGSDIKFLSHNNIAIINVPYINSDGDVKLGIIIEIHLLKNIPPYVCFDNPLTNEKDYFVYQNSHTVYFDGEFPCDLEFEPINNLVFPGGTQFPYAPGFTTKFLMSTKPECGYYNSHQEKLLTYFEYISDPAFALMKKKGISIDDIKKKDNWDPLIANEIFIYSDNAANSVFSNSLSYLFENLKIAIIGVGGTGSYILDLVSRTPVAEIHLFDCDEFNEHNAFRAPGIYTDSLVAQKMNKAKLHATRYSSFRYGIVPHDICICENNINILDNFDFVFINIDSGKDKNVIVDHLVNNRTPFIDNGITVDLVSEKMMAMTNLVFFDGTNKNLVDKHITIAEESEDPYDSNIQIAEINSIVACQAVIKWKQHIGFYHDTLHDNTVNCEIHKGVYNHVKN